MKRLLIATTFLLGAVFVARSQEEIQIDGLSNDGTASTVADIYKPASDVPTGSGRFELPKGVGALGKATGPEAIAIEALRALPTLARLPFAAIEKREPLGTHRKVSHVTPAGFVGNQDLDGRVATIAQAQPNITPTEYLAWCEDYLRSGWLTGPLHGQYTFKLWRLNVGPSRLTLMIDGIYAQRSDTGPETHYSLVQCQIEFSKDTGNVILYCAESSNFKTDWPTPPLSHYDSGATRRPGAVSPSAK